MEIERRILQLERQTFWLKLMAFPAIILAGLSFLMGAASFDPDRGEPLKIIRIQLVNAAGEEGAVIDADGINYHNKGSQFTADSIVGRSRITANSDPKAKERYAEIGVSPDGRNSYLMVVYNGSKSTVHISDNGSSVTNF